MIQEGLFQAALTPCGGFEMRYPPLSITSAANERVKNVLSLYNRRDRDRENLFIIEGFREAFRAVQGGVQIVELFFCKKLFLGTHEGDLLDTCQERGATLIELPEVLFRKVSYRDRPDGIIAVAQKMNYDLSSIALSWKSGVPLVVIAEAIEKPGNLGTIIRSSDAAGVDLVIVANACTDIYNPNVVRASVGTLFTLPVVEATNEEALSFCKKQSLQMIATVPDGAFVYTDVPMTGPLGIVVGTEQLGLSSFWKNECHSRVKIPMHGVADSLNVATATTLFLFEAARQRGS